MTTSASAARGSSLVRPFRGVSAAERQRIRRAALIAAGLELFGTRGIAGVTIGEVCDEARLNKRYFYESFDSIDDLVNAVVEQVISELTDGIVPVISHDGWRNPRPAISYMVNALMQDPRVTRLLVIETHSGALTHHRQQFVTLAVETWLTADADHTDDPEELAARRLLAYAFVGAAGEVVIAWLSGYLDLTPEQVIDRLVLLFERIAPQS